MVVAVYPGTFDPMTRGHEDLVRRASNIFDELVVGLPTAPTSVRSFRWKNASALRARCWATIPTCASRVSGLLKDFVRKNNARVIVRGLRAVSDFEYEFQMAGMNRYLLPDVETMFLTPSDQYQFISGTFVREIAVLGGDVSKVRLPLGRTLAAAEDRQDGIKYEFETAQPARRVRRAGKEMPWR